MYVSKYAEQTISPPAVPPYAPLRSPVLIRPGFPPPSHPLQGPTPYLATFCRKAIKAFMVRPLPSHSNVSQDIYKVCNSGSIVSVYCGTNSR